MNSISRAFCTTLAVWAICAAVCHRAAAQDTVTPAGTTERWLFNFRNPSYCKMILCNGSCAYTSSEADPGCRLVPMYPVLRIHDQCSVGCCHQL